MNYDQTIQFLFERLPMYQKIGNKALKKDLTNISKLCDLLGNPHMTYPSIHIAGTNGKGTTAHMIAAIFQSAGFKVGLYTSPHYEDFRERIKVNGAYIPEEAIRSFVSKIKKNLDDLPASFFEITVAMAFDYFADSQIDIAIIETGLGGRLDSTNIINPVLSVITNISLDHQKVLGDNHYKIAFEKAGIIKHQKPVIIGKYQPTCDHVFFKVAKEKNASLSIASLMWKTSKVNSGWKFKKNRETIIVQSDESSPFHLENMTTALETISVYNKVGLRKIETAHIEVGLESFRTISNYKGRWQIVQESPRVILDSAHNLEAIQKVLKHLSTYKAETIQFVLGFVKEKELPQILSHFESKHQYYFTKPSIPRGLSESELKEEAHKIGLKGSTYETVEKAVKSALSEVKKDGLIFIGGSSFVVADALKYWSKSSAGTT